MAEAEASKPAPPAGKKKPILLIIGVVVLVLTLLVGKVMIGGSKAQSKPKKLSREVGVTMPLDEFLVNLSGSGDHYLRASISLGLVKGVTEEGAKEHTAALRDAILTVLSSKSLKDLSDPNGKEGLKQEIFKKVNEEGGEEQLVAKVYFTAFATQ